MGAVVELVITARQAQAADALEQVWRTREAARRWNDSDEVCERLLDWLRRPRQH